MKRVESKKALEVIEVLQRGLKEKGSLYSGVAIYKGFVDTRYSDNMYYAVARRWNGCATSNPHGNVICSSKTLKGLLD